MKWRGQASEKRVQNDSKDDPRSWKRMEKMQEMFTKDLEELKDKEMEMKNPLEGIKAE